MFDLGWQEIFVIGTVALIVVGLGIRQYFQNQAKIEEWDLDQAKRIKEMNLHFQQLENNSSKP